MGNLRAHYLKFAGTTQLPIDSLNAILAFIGKKSCGGHGGGNGNKTLKQFAAFLTRRFSWNLS